MKSNENTQPNQFETSHADACTRLSRRRFLGASALLGIGFAGLGPRIASAAPTRTGASGFQSLEVNSPMAKWKKPQSLDFVRGATERYSFRNWQSGNDDSVYYNLKLPAFFKCNVVMPPAEFSVLKRNIQPSLLSPLKHMTEPRRPH